MAERRMFTKKVTDDDNFVQLSSSAQALYLHLSMSADDDGFSNQVSLSMFKAHASVQDLEALLAKRYLYQFENGVIVIKHWRMANALRKDRYSPTAFQEELKKLELKKNGAYTWLPDGCQTVAKRLPQDRLDKDRLDKDRGEINKESEDFVFEEQKPKETFVSKVENFTQNEELRSALRDFIEMRKKSKGAFTLRAMDLALNTLTKITTDEETQITVVNRTIENGWKSFFPLSGEKVNKKETIEEKTMRLQREMEEEGYL